MKPTISTTWPSSVYVLIPAYKSAELLDEFLPKLSEAMPKSHVLVVDDGSRDNTQKVCAKHGVSCTAMPVNEGKGAALRVGFSRLMVEGAAWVITMDADGQHAIDDLPEFLDEITNNPSASLIIGARDRGIGKMPFQRICSNTITSTILSRLTGQKILDSQCGYRAYSAKLLKNVVFRYDRFEMESEVILRASYLGLGIAFVPVQTLYCSDLSHISHLKDTIRWSTAVLRIWFELKLRTK